jgi:hypothetical protein
VAERRKAGAPLIESRAAAQAAIGEQCVFRRFASLLFVSLLSYAWLMVSKARAFERAARTALLYPPPRSGGGGPPKGRWRGHAAVELASRQTPLLPPFGRSPLPATRGGISDVSLRASAKQSRAACAGSWIAWSLPLLAMTSLGRAKARCCLFARSVILSPLPLAGEDAPKARERVRPPFRAKRRRPLIPTFSPRAGRRCVPASRRDFHFVRPREAGEGTMRSMVEGAGFEAGRYLPCGRALHATSSAGGRKRTAYAASA